MKKGNYFSGWLGGLQKTTLYLQLISIELPLGARCFSFGW
jgi:hypothetical protein